MVDGRAADVAELTASVQEMREALSLRERQLALMLTHLEASKVEVEGLRTRGSVEEVHPTLWACPPPGPVPNVPQPEAAHSVHCLCLQVRLRGVLAEREAALVSLVRDLYELASVEKVPGVVAHDARSSVFSRCAAIYDALGQAAFAEPPPPRPESAVLASADGEHCRM